MRIIDEDEVRSVLHYDALIPAVARALADFSAGKIIQPVRTIISIPTFGNFFGAMPAVYGDIMGAKLVALVPSNAARGIHTHQAVIQIFDTKTGAPLATMDGRLITEMRTAAASAAAINLLAKPNASTLAILGSGVQARAHAAAIRHVRPITDIRLWGRNAAEAKRCATEVGATYAPSAEAAVRGADIVTTVTASKEPVLHGAWVTDATCVVAVGALGATNREVDTETLRGTAIVDSREAARTEAGDMLLANASVYAELGELVAGTVPLPTRGPFFFKSLGMAAEDLAAARLVYQVIEKKERGASH